jgi:tetratricopeptide (TPR) repeat protein
MKLAELLLLARRNWHTLTGLVSAIAIQLVLLGALFAFAKVSPLTALALTALLVAATFGVWVWHGRVPRAPNDKIGVAIAIRCDEDEAVQKTVRSDFVNALKKQINDSPSREQFVVYTMPDHITENVQDAKGAFWLKEKSGCRFIFFGQVRKRQIVTTDRYFIDLDGLVAHNPLRGEAQQQLEREFSELAPRRVNFEVGIGLLGFEFTSKWAHVVSKYVIGLAMAYSGLFDQAEPLLLEAEDLARRIPNPLPAYEKIRTRAPRVRAQIHLAKAELAYRRWRETRSESDLAHVQSEANQAEQVENKPALLTLQAILAFASNRNCGEARRLLNEIPGDLRNALWHFNMGFLRAYEGNLKAANQLFRRGAQLPLPAHQISELEEFMVWALTEEPDRFHLHYFLGHLNRTLKGDAETAIRDFEAFLQKLPPNQHARDRTAVQGWIAQLQLQLQDAPG